MHFKYRKVKRILPKNESNIWALVALHYGQWLPSTGAVDAHLVGYGCPCNGHKQTNRRA